MPIGDLNGQSIYFASRGILKQLEYANDRIKYDQMNNISSCLYNMLQKFNHTMMYPIINNNKIIISYYYTYNL